MKKFIKKIFIKLKMHIYKRNKMHKFIEEISIELGLDIDGDIFNAVNRVTGQSVAIYVNNLDNSIKIIKFND